jgi:Flp pilus assembly pilin Flp
MTNFRAAIGRLVRSEDGPTMVEYAAMILFLSLLCFAVLQAMGVEFQKLFNSLATTMQSLP